MDIFTHKQFTKWTIAILVLLNLVALVTILVFVLQGPIIIDRGEEPEGPEPLHFFLQKELGLTADQMRRFKGMGDEFRQESAVIRNDIHQLKEQLMAEIFAPLPDETAIDRLSGKIGEGESRLAKLMYSHFKDLASICDETQRKKFEEVLQEVLELTRPPHPEGPPGFRPPAKKKPPQEPLT